MLSMRDAFLEELYSLAQGDRNVVLLSGDFGAPALDKFREHLPEQFINVGIAEQNMINVARGLAMVGKTVYTYLILPFYLRCYEQIRHLCMQNLNVTMVGVGAGFAYDTAGPTHHALEDITAMRVFPNISIWNPSSSNMAAALAHLPFYYSGPKYVRLDRTVDYQSSIKIEAAPGLRRWGIGDACIIATGCMVKRADQICQELSAQGLKVCYVDLYRLKPVNVALLLEVFKESRLVITMDESFSQGGMGSIVAEVKAAYDLPVPMQFLGLDDRYVFLYGGREQLLRQFELDLPHIIDYVAALVKGVRDANPR